MEEQKGKIAVWSLSVIIICIVGFVATIWMMGQAMDAKIEGLHKAINAVGTVEDVRGTMDNLKNKVDQMDKKIDKMRSVQMAPPPPAPAPVPSDKK